ncbi:ankyrin repeat-containing protein BDA1-like isoform X2 [Benincasa hispida]|nr:ankyrin repeat-containing protein BDA1-like isoform X2 [Benincasa hispida]
MMRLKPSLAKKLNPKGYSPIHLAMKNDRTETVFRLADVDRDLVTLHGKKGLTPLHIAASKGKDKFLAKFLISYPESIKGLTDREESALHIAVKKDKIGALGILLEWTKQANMNSILNWSDDEGNNIMHVAALEGNNIMHLTATEGNNIRNLETLENKVKMVKLLLSYKVDIKSKNLEGLTAMDILRRGEFLRDKELREKLDGNHILKQPILAKLWSLVKAFFGLNNREILHTSKENRNAILVVSVLIATATYQVLLSLSDKDNEISPLKFEFEAINLRIDSYQLFKASNTMAFFSSMMEIFLHLPSDINYTLHLGVPLVTCYILLIPFRWSSFDLVHIAGGYIVLLVLSKIPNIAQKLRECFNTRKLIKINSLIKRSLSRDRELTEIRTEMRQHSN